MIFKRWRAAAAERLAPSDDRDVPLDAATLDEATQELAQMLQGAYMDRQNRLHCETLVGGAAALTGEFALRATGLPLPATGFVFGDPINEILYQPGERRTLWDVVEMVTGITPLAPADLPDPIAVFRRVADSIALILKGSSGSFPPLTCPRINYPREWSPNAGPRLRAKVFAIGRQHDLTTRQLAFTLAYATLGVVKHRQEALGPAIAVTLWAEIMFATARMAPLARPV